MLKNVIIVSDFAVNEGGAAQVAIASAVALSSHGYRVTYFSAVGPVDPRLAESEVNVVCLGHNDILHEANRLKAMFRGVWNAEAKKTFRKMLQNYSPDDTVVHFHAISKSLTASLWTVVAQLGFETFLTLHDFFYFCPNGGLYNYQRQCICNKVPSSLSCYVANCDSRSYLHKLWRDIRQMVQNSVMRRVPKVNLIYISKLNYELSRPALDTIAKQWFFVQNPVFLNKREPVDVSENEYYMFMGRLSPEKGADMFCEAVSELGLKAMVLGDGPQREALQRRYKNIEFHGWVDGEQKDSLVRRCKCLVFPSKWYETYGLVVAEMKSYGIPSIVADKTAAAEQIVGGRTGEIFEIGNKRSLIEAIKRFELNGARFYSDNIVETFSKEEVSLETYVKRLAEVYSELIVKHRNTQI